MLTPYAVPLPSSWTPERLFACLERWPYPIWLDSGQGQFRSLGRYSFLAAEPFLRLRLVQGRCHIAEVQAPEGERVIGGDPFAVIEETLRRFPQRDDPALPPFQGGAAGYLGYEMGRFIERVPSAATDDWPLPEAALAWYHVVLAWDHLTGAAWLIASGHPEGTEAVARRRARAWMERLTSALDVAERANGSGAAVSEPAADGAVVATFTRALYCRAIERAQAFIAAGDIYQVNLSQRFAVPVTVAPPALYRRLRRVSPAPFSAFVGLPEGALLSASPERFLRIRDGLVQTRPIKGTRPRGGAPEEDRRLREALVASVKDRAEHVMIVDLERNDLGRVCRYGSVRVAELMTAESYAQVHHLVSTIEGRLRPDVGVADVWRATFPGGSITGAPKVRAMQIIAALEPTRRGAYTGALGYWAFSGAADWSIVIRTLTVSGGWAQFQVGGGIVADSDPVAEYQETLDKASGLVRALGLRASHSWLQSGLSPQGTDPIGMIGAKR